MTTDNTKVWTMDCEICWKMIMKIVTECVGYGRRKLWWFENSAQ